MMRRMRNTAERPEGPINSPLTRRVLRDDVRDAVMGMLLDGRFAPGTSLGIDQLSRQFNVSATPVREALVELEATGLIERVAHRGYQVAPPMSAEQMRELGEARLVVETLAAQWAAARRSPEFLAKLLSAHAAHLAAAQAVRQWDGFTRDKDGIPAPLRPYFMADWAFHLVILDYCGNRYIRQMAQGLGSSLHRLRQSVSHGTSDAGQAVAEHERVLNAFLSGNVDDVTGAMHEHLAGFLTRSVAEA